MTKNNIIAIDGHSSCGKSTLAKRLAKQFGYRYIDTGAMYRAVTLFAVNAGMFSGADLDTAVLRSEIENGNLKIDFAHNSETGFSETLLNGINVEADIRGTDVARRVSTIATVEFVRSYLVQQQQKMGKNGNIVMDGRDITTVVFPNADVKIFLTARLDVRAERRYKELIAKGEVISFDDVKENISKRDFIDSTRKDSPLTQSPDAVLLDNSDLTQDETLAVALEIILNKQN